MSTRTKRAADITVGDIICGTTHRAAMRVDAIEVLGHESVQRRKRSVHPHRLGAAIGEAKQVRQLMFRSKRADGTTRPIIICRETALLKVVTA
jgi:hypothetical protein